MRHRFFNILVIVIGGGLSFACSEKFDYLYEAPEAKITVSTETPTVNNAFTIAFEGSGQEYVVFPGDNGHNYYDSNSTNTGFVFNDDGILNYSYSNAGTYRILCIATGYKSYGEDLVTDTFGINVVVSANEEDFAITNVAVNKNMYGADIIFHQELRPGEVIPGYNPAQQVYVEEGKVFGTKIQIPSARFDRYITGRNDPSSSVKLKMSPSFTPTTEVTITIGEDNYVNGESTIMPYSVGSDNVYAPFTLTINSTGGDAISKDYTVCFMEMAEFKMFNIGGETITVTSKRRKNAKYITNPYNLQEMMAFFTSTNFASGTDLSAIPISFELFPDQFVSKVEYSTDKDFTTPVVLSNGEDVTNKTIDISSKVGYIRTTVMRSDDPDFTMQNITYVYVDYSL